MEKTIDLNDSESNYLRELEEQEVREVKQGMKVEHRYPSLKLIETILQVFAWTGGVVIAAIFGISLERGFSPVILIALVGGVASCILLATFAEVLQVVIDIEANTRRSWKEQQRTALLTREAARREDQN